MNFHDTIMGKRFFEAQLPKLIKAIEKLAEEVSENNKLLRELKENKKEDINETNIKIKNTYH